MERDDVRVSEGGDDASFPFETPEGFVGLEAWRQHLDGDLASETGVDGAIDDLLSSPV